MAIIQNMRLVVAEVTMERLAHHRLLWLAEILVMQAHLVSFEYRLLVVDSYHSETCASCSFPFRTK